jgi:hypothetical protein
MLRDLVQEALLILRAMYFHQRRHTTRR